MPQKSRNLGPLILNMLFPTDSLHKFIEKLWPEIFSRKRKYDFCLMQKMIRYITKTGTQWRNIPKYYLH